MPIDIAQASTLGGHKNRQQPWRCIDALELAEKLTQRRILIARANERLKRMFVAIEATEAFNPS